MFMIVYHTRTDGAWRFSDVGRWLMLSRFSIMTVCVLAVINRIFDDWFARDVATVVVFALFAFQITWPVARLMWPRVDYRDEEEVDSDTRT